MRAAAVVVVCAALLALASAADVEGRIRTNQVLASLSKLDPNARVILSGGDIREEALVRADGQFSFFNLPSGTYLLQVSASGLHFDPVRIDVSSAGGLRRAFSVQIGTSSKDDAGSALLLPLILEPRGGLTYFTKRQGFSLWSLVSNPMLLSAIVPIALLFGMQKMMSGIDPETMREAQEAQAQLMSSLKGGAATTATTAAAK